MSGTLDGDVGVTMILSSFQDVVGGGSGDEKESGEKESWKESEDFHEGE